MSVRVVVIGGGYAGCMAANRLVGRSDVEVTLVNNVDVFVERIRLHQLATGTATATVGWGRVLSEAVRVRIGRVVRIDAGARDIVFDDGSRLGYDYAVYAVGSGDPVDVPATVDAEVFQIAVRDDAARLAERLAHDARSVVVVGGGLTGVEAAAEIAERHRESDVTLVCGGQLVPSAGEKGRRSVARHLASTGVTVREAETVTEVDAGKVMLSDGRVLSADVTVWAAGVGIPRLAADSGLDVDADGRLMVDDTLVSSEPRIVGAGDAVAVHGIPLRMSCQAAMPLGAQAAQTITAAIDGRTPNRIDQGFAAQCISVGRRRATIVRTDRSDVARGLYAGGRAAAPVKELVCRMTIRWLADEARTPGLYSWRRSA